MKGHQMTKRDLELIASVLRDHKAAGIDNHDEWMTLVYAFADRLADANPRFNRSTFLLAAGAPTLVVGATKRELARAIHKERA
jgi:hypothetical protein